MPLLSQPDVKRRDTKIGEAQRLRQTATTGKNSPVVAGGVPPCFYGE